jgi:hypothetical protein
MLTQPISLYTHTCTYTCTLTRTLTHTLAHTHTHAHTHTRIHTRTHIHTYTHTHVYICKGTVSKSPVVMQKEKKIELIDAKRSYTVSILFEHIHNLSYMFWSFLMIIGFLALFTVFY